MGGEATKIKEYTLEKSKQFVVYVIENFSEHLSDELLILGFKNLFKSEKDFYRHLFKHGIPDEWKLSFVETRHIKLTWKDIKHLLEQHPQDFKKFAKQYFMEILKALAHPTTTFYEIPFEGAKPNIVIFSGHHRRVVITLEGEKLQSSYILKGQVEDYIKERKHRSISFLEVGIDEELRELARQIRNLYKRLGGHS